MGGELPPAGLNFPVDYIKLDRDVFNRVYLERDCT